MCTHHREEHNDAVHHATSTDLIRLHARVLSEGLCAKEERRERETKYMREL